MSVKDSALPAVTTFVGSDIFAVTASSVTSKITATNLMATIFASPTITGHPVIEGVTSTGATGTGKFVFDTSPTLVTPALGVATATSINGLTVTATTGTVTIPNGVTLTGPASSGTAATLGNAETFTANKIFTTTVTTGSGATAGLQVTANSLTTGNGLEVSSSSVSAGNVVSIAATGTAAASSTKTALNVSTSGANATSAMTTYGGQFANTSTGTTSVNIGLQASASGGATNYALLLSGSLAGGTASGGNLALVTTTHATKGYIGIDGFTAGIAATANATLYVYANGVPVASTGSGAVDWKIRAGGVFQWANGSDATQASDTGFSRISAGLIAVGNGTNGSFAGDLKLNNIIVTSTTDSTTTTTGALQVAGGAAIRKRVFIDGITTSAGTQTAVLCQSSGGEMIADSVACLASSARFKENIRPLTSGLDEVMKLRPVSYRYKSEGIFAKNVNFHHERVGFTAEDVAKVDVRFVGFEPDGITPRTIGYDTMVPLLTKAIQEQQLMLEQQSAAIQMLESRIKTLMTRH